MRFFRVLGAIVLVGLVLALGAGIYQAGVMAGGAGGGPATVPYWYGPWFGPWLGFGLFHLFGLLLFIFLIAGLVRLVFLGGRHGWGAGYGHGRSGDGRNAPNGPRGPMGRGGDWEQRMRAYHDHLHATAAGGLTESPVTRPAATPPAGSSSGDSSSGGSSSGGSSPDDPAPGG